MTWRFFRWGETTSVRELVARHEYDKAIGVLRATLKQRPGDRRLRLDLAEVLVHAGQKPQAIKMLLELADELFRGDFRARARVVLKRVEDLEPGRPDVAERLEVLNQMEKAVPRRPAGGVPWVPAAPLPDAPETNGNDGRPNAVPVAVASTAGPLVDSGDDEIRIDTTALDAEANTEAQAVGPSGNALFQGLPPDLATTLLPRPQRLERDAGDVLVTEGEKGNALFLILRGTVSVFVKDKAGQSARVAQLHAGEFFGEVAALTGLRRIATVTAATPCELLVVEKSVLAKLLASHPKVRERLEESLEQRVGDPRANAARGKKVHRHLPGRRKKGKRGSRGGRTARGVATGISAGSSNPSRQEVADEAKRLPGVGSRADRIAEAQSARWRRGFSRSG